MLHRLALALFAAVPVLITSATQAQVTLDSSQVLRIHFVTTPPFNVTPDVLSLNFGLITVNAPFGSRTAELYDCGALLATHTDSLFGSSTGALSLSPTNTFASSTSLYTFLNPATADFTPIVNGSIQGILQFRIASGSITLPSLGQVTLRMIRASGSSGGLVVSPSPTITAIDIAPQIALTPGTPTGINTLSATGATPGSTMFFSIGTLCAPLPLFFCPNSPIYDILNPLAFIPVPVDATGAASLQLDVPATTAGLTFLFQGVEQSACLQPTSLLPTTF